MTILPTHSRSRRSNRSTERQCLRRSWDERTPRRIKEPGYIGGNQTGRNTDKCEVTLPSPYLSNGVVESLSVPQGWVLGQSGASLFWVWLVLAIVLYFLSHEDWRSQWQSQQWNLLIFALLGHTGIRFMKAHGFSPNICVANHILWHQMSGRWQSLWWKGQ